MHDLACLAPAFRSAAADTRCEAVDEVDLERLRTDHVPSNRPAVLRGVLSDWPPLERWSDDAYLRAAAPQARVRVRRASADGSVSAGGGAYELDEVDWPALVDAHAEAESRGRAAHHYAAQLRLRTDLPRLFADTQPVPACVGALGHMWSHTPSAYFGCGHATPLHFDLLENLLCVVRGRKQVTLWHPGDSGLLYPSEGSDAAFSRANVYAPDLTTFPRLHDAAARALHVELSAGDALYIPVCWWHAVRTPAGKRSISVSYWTQQPSGKACEPVDADDEWGTAEDDTT